MRTVYKYSHAGECWETLEHIAHGTHERIVHTTDGAGTSHGGGSMAWIRDPLMSH